MNNKGRGQGRPQRKKRTVEGKKESDQFMSKKGKVFRAKPKFGAPEKKKANPGKVSKVNDGSIRLNKFIANAGICSRREADVFIQSGVVTVNGEICLEMGKRVYPGDAVNFEGQKLTAEKKVYILLNKPKGYVTTVDDPDKDKTVLDLIKGACRERIYPVGRLDKTSTGLLMLTNDGDLTTKLTHPKYNRKKIYHVFTDKKVTKNHLNQILEGFNLEDGFIKPDSVSYVDDRDLRQVGIEIHSGRPHIVRRIFAHFGYKVEKLDRVYFCGLTKKNLPRGKWRMLSQEEVNLLKMGKF